MVAKEGREVGGEMDWEFRISRCRLACIEWIKTGFYFIAQELYSVSCEKQ